MIKRRLIVTIPCFNEEKTLVEVIKTIPKKIKGITSIRVLVVDDGSTDNSASLAKKAGAEVFSHTKNEGLGPTFTEGIRQALLLSADIIVNIDGDLQFNSKDIPKIAAPVIQGKADKIGRA